MPYDAFLIAFALRFSERSGGRLVRPARHSARLARVEAS